MLILLTILFATLTLSTTVGLGMSAKSLYTELHDEGAGGVDWLDTIIRLIAFTAASVFGGVVVHQLIKSDLPKPWTMVTIGIILTGAFIYYFVRHWYVDKYCAPEFVKEALENNETIDRELLVGEDGDEYDIWSGAVKELGKWRNAVVIMAVTFLVSLGTTVYAASHPKSLGPSISGNSASGNAASGNQINLDSISGNKKTTQTKSAWGGNVDQLLVDKFGEVTKEDKEVYEKWKKHFAKSGVSSDPLKENDEARLAQSSYSKPVRFAYTKAKSKKTTVKEFRRALAQDPIYSGGMAQAVNKHFAEIVKKYPRVQQFAELYDVVYQTPDADYDIGNVYWMDGTGQNLNQVTKYYMAWTIEFFAQEYKYSGVETRDIRLQWGLPIKFGKEAPIPSVVAGQVKEGDVIPNNLRRLYEYTDKGKTASVVWVHRQDKTENFGTGVDNQNFRLFVKKQAKITKAATPTPSVKANPKSNPGNPGTQSNPSNPSDPNPQGNPGDGGQPAGETNPGGTGQPAVESEPADQGDPGYTPSESQETPKDTGGSSNYGNDSDNGGGSDTTQGEATGNVEPAGPPPSTGGDNSGSSSDSGGGSEIPPQDTNGGSTHENIAPVEASEVHQDTIVDQTNTDADGNTTITSGSTSDKIQSSHVEAD